MIHPQHLLAGRWLRLLGAASIVCITPHAVVAVSIEEPTASSTSIPMEAWMGHIYSINTNSIDMYDIQFKDILLPGSHNAGAYKILDTTQGDDNNNIPTCGGATYSNFPKDLLLSFELSGGVNLVETQQLPLLDQLLRGIRFLDLRLGLLPADDGEVRVHHTFFMDVTLQKVLQDVVDFLSAYSTEVVILKLRLQCGVSASQVLDLLESVLGANNIDYGDLTPDALTSSLPELQGQAFVIWDTADSEMARRSVPVEEYYKTHACAETTSRFFNFGGGGGGDTCYTWPGYNPNQGTWLTDTIAEDSMVDDGTQLSDWKPETTTEAFRVVSFVGVIPLGQGCDPASDTALGAALLTCQGIDIDSYTETFAASFGDMVRSLTENGMTSAINVIQVDYVDTFDWSIVVHINREALDGLSPLYHASTGSLENMTIPTLNGTSVISVWNATNSTNATSAYRNESFLG